MNNKKLLLGLIIFTGFSYIAKNIYCNLSKKKNNEKKKYIDCNHKWKELYYNLKNNQITSLDKATQTKINTNNSEEFNIVTIDKSLSGQNLLPKKNKWIEKIW